MPGSRPGGTTCGAMTRAATAPSRAAPIRAAFRDVFDMEFSFGGKRGREPSGSPAHHRIRKTAAARGSRHRCALTAVRSLGRWRHGAPRSEEHTSELQSLMRISYAVFCLNKKKKTPKTVQKPTQHKYQ